MYVEFLLQIHNLPDDTDILELKDRLHGLLCSAGYCDEYDSDVCLEILEHTGHCDECDN